MATVNGSFASLIASVVSNLDEIDSYIWTANFMLEEHGEKSHGHDVSTPFEYLRDWREIRFWEEYFSRVMHQWDEDKMSGMRLNAIIERLSAPASTLDVLIPKFEKECRRFPKMPESVVRNAREMHTSVNSFLNSADDGLNYWKKSENALIENEIRQRRPIIRQHPTVDDPVSSDVAETAEEQPGDGAVGLSRLHSIGGIITSNDGLLALTGIVSIASCILQARAYFVSNQLPSNSKGSVDDPDFYNAIQTFLLQMLGLHTALAPALRSTVPRYEFWAWLLSVLSLGAGIGGIAVYPFSKPLSPLLACISNCLQAYVTLALVFSIGRITQVDNVRREV